MKHTCMNTQMTEIRIKDKSSSQKTIHKNMYFEGLRARVPNAAAKWPQ